MSLNKVILLGRLGKDPELRYTPSQMAICKFTIATNERKKSAEGEWTESTEWHNIVTFGKTAENCANYLGKGSQALVEGRIQSSKYQDQQGNEKYWTEIIANNIQFVGAKGDGQGISVSKSQPKAVGQTPPPSAEQMEKSVSFDDDDIPF